jgi:hypothetical protein
MLSILSGLAGARYEPTEHAGRLPTVPIVKRGALLRLSVVIVILIAGCGDEAGQPASTDDEAVVVAGEPDLEVSIDGAIAVGVATAPSGSPAVAWVTSDGVHSARLDTESGELEQALVVSGDVVPMAHPIERPAVLVREDDTVDVAFTAPASGGGSVYLSRDGGGPHPISGPPRPETNLVHMTRSPDGHAVFAWLEDSTLSVAREDQGHTAEVEGVDDLTCDCCNSVPVFSGDMLVIGYRDLDRVDGAVVRNVVAIMSHDGGATFDDPSPIADDDWFIDGCPFSGPSLAVDGDQVYATWMVARQSIYPDQTASSIWFDRSSGVGGSFGRDVVIAEGGRFTWPSMTVDDSGMIHVVWETQGSDGGLSYSSSDDQGATFGSPVLLVDREDNGGPAPGSPTLVFDDGRLILTWADERGGHVAVWEISGS